MQKLSPVSLHNLHLFSYKKNKVFSLNFIAPSPFFKNIPHSSQILNYFYQQNIRSFLTACRYIIGAIQKSLKEWHQIRSDRKQSLCSSLWLKKDCVGYLLYAWKASLLIQGVEAGDTFKLSSAAWILKCNLDSIEYSL